MTKTPEIESRFLLQLEEPRFILVTEDEVKIKVEWEDGGEIYTFVFQDNKLILQSRDVY